jgi:bacteriorhodopsin
MRLRFSRLRWPEWVIGAGGLLLLFSTFVLPWYQLTRSTPGPPPKFFVEVSQNGWHGVTHARWLLLVTILAAFAVVFFQARQRAPALPIAATVFAVPLAALTVLWLIYRVWINPAGGREIGGWIGLLSAAAIVYGGYKSIRTEGIAEEDAPTEIPAVRLEGERAT